jgi:mono/diheme cytochrome c family protein
MRFPFVCIAPFLLVSCAAPRVDETLSASLPLDDPKLVAGQQVFMRNCYQCHPGGGAGLGPSLNDKGLPGFAIRTQVRNGFGAMPAFDDKRISDQDLENVVAYLKALRGRQSG